MKMIHLEPKRNAQVTGFVVLSLAVAAISILLCSLVMRVCWAAELPEDERIVYLKKLSLEDLLGIEVTSVAKKRERLSDAAAAIFVITNEDIRRSGATSIPEALRMVPGLQVARIDSNKWAVTSRGFNGRFANKLLVLIDGRTMYTPLYSGVFWTMQDTLLEDVERIEVIRGPGATLWGANAVNGVINIITKQAMDTLGGLVAAGIGTEERGFANVRYGSNLGDNAYFRVFAKYFDRDNGLEASGQNGGDDSHVLRGGFRIDWQPSDRDSLTFQGDIYKGDAGQRLTVASSAPPYTAQTFDEGTEIGVGNVLTRWTRVFSNSSDMALQLYFERAEREDSLVGILLDTWDLDFQHKFALGARQEIVWGLGYRFVHHDMDNTFNMSFRPPTRDDHLFSAFLQDDIMLVKEKLCLTLGSKLEHNDYTGFENQPNVRLQWTPHERHSVWAALSRAVRTPSRADHDIQINQPHPDNLPVIVSLYGSRDFKSEDLLAYELGYRFQPMDRLSADIAAFYNDYDNLRTIEPDPNPFVPAATAGNKMEGEAYGVELAANWLALDWWRFQAAYTYLQIQLHLDPDSRDTVSERAEGESPHHQLFLRSSMDLSRDLELDLWVRYVDSLPDLGVRSYVSLDARLGWRPRQDLELSIVGQNLVDSHHSEFGPDAFVKTSPTEVERSVYGKITWSF